MKKDNLNPDLMIGDEVTVIDVDSSFGTMNTAERFKDYVVTAIKQSNQTQETYYDIKPINETDEELLGRMLAGGGMIRREHLYPTDTWMLRKGFLRGELEEEPNEIARTLSKARKHGVGTRFPKAAIEANPQRFRKYTRDKYLKEHNQPGLNPILKVDDIVRVIDVDGEHGRMPKRFETYIVVKVGKTYPLMAMRNRGYHNEYYDIRPYPDSSTQFSELDIKSLYRGDTWIYANIPMANKVDRKTIGEHKESKKLNPELMVGDEILVVSTERIHDFGAPELYKPYVVVGIKHGTTMMKGGKELEDYPYYQVEPIGMTDEERTGAMLAGGGRMKPMYIFPRQDQWIYANVPMANKVDRKTIGEQVNPEDYGIIDGEKKRC